MRISSGTSCPAEEIINKKEAKRMNEQNRLDLIKRNAKEMGISLEESTLLFIADRMVDMRINTNNLLNLESRLSSIENRLSKIENALSTDPYGESIKEMITQIRDQTLYRLYR